MRATFFYPTFGFKHISSFWPCILVPIAKIRSPARSKSQILAPLRGAITVVCREGFRGHWPCPPPQRSWNYDLSSPTGRTNGWPLQIYRNNSLWSSQNLATLSQKRENSRRFAAHTYMTQILQLYKFWKWGNELHEVCGIAVIAGPRDQYFCIMLRCATRKRVTWILALLTLWFQY